MCGIAGWIDHSQDMSERIDLLNRMSETLDRRGPDENGLYINRGAALMHRRLVVIDRENGKQPMSVRHTTAPAATVPARGQSPPVAADLRRASPAWHRPCDPSPP